MNAENIKKTILAAIGAIAGLAVAFGWFTPEQVTDLNPHLTSIGENIIGILVGVGSIWKIFKPSKTETTKE